MKVISSDRDAEILTAAATALTKASFPVALTGAGISVNSGIADFRSPGGIWTVFTPEEYATIDVFRRDPEKAWKLYRELGKALVGKQPNKGHKALVKLEEKDLLRGIITQNIDNLHQAAGSNQVYEIHGDHKHLHCIECGHLEEITENHFDPAKVPLCSLCRYPLKPNVVLFGEAVRNLAVIENLINQTDLLLVIGTSAQVYPAATLPATVKYGGGLVYEFNLEPALASSEFGTGPYGVDYFFEGDLSATLPKFVQAVESIVTT